MRMKHPRGCRTGHIKQALHRTTILHAAQFRCASLSPYEKRLTCKPIVPNSICLPNVAACQGLRRSLTNDAPRSYVNLTSARRAQSLAWLIE
jgi:hypothetical protein